MDAALDHLQGRIVHGREGVGDDTVDIGDVQIRVQHHHRNLGGGLGDVLILLLFFVDEIGARQDDAVHFLREQQVHGGGLGFQSVAGAAQKAVVAAGPQLPLDIVDRLGQVQVGTVRAHDADGLHGVQP